MYGTCTGFPCKWDAATVGDMGSTYRNKGSNQLYPRTTPSITKSPPVLGRQGSTTLLCGFNTVMRATSTAASSDTTSENTQFNGQYTSAMHGTNRGWCRGKEGQEERRVPVQ